MTNSFGYTVGIFHRNDAVCYSQEKRIYDLKKKNQELEKFKFVLDYKIKELKKQIEPREKDIKQMREQISEVCDALVTFSRPNCIRIVVLYGTV